MSQPPSLHLLAGLAVFAFASTSGAASVMQFNVPNGTLGAGGADNGTYTEAGMRIREDTFTGLNIDNGKLQDGGWGGGFELASTTPDQLFSLLSFDGNTRYGNPAGVTVTGYNSANQVKATESFTLTGSLASYTLSPAFVELSRVVFRNQSDPEFDNITFSAVPEPSGVLFGVFGMLGLIGSRRRRNS